MKPLCKKIFLIKLIFLSVLLINLSAFAASYRCTTSGAYKIGYDDALQNRPMQVNYWKTCYAGSRIFMAYKHGYRDAYFKKRFGNAGKTKQCIETNGGKVCGYGCVTTKYGKAYCAKKPGQYCMADSFHHHACGYVCMKTRTSVKCATVKGDNCVIDSVGHIKCGKNCKAASSGEITCDTER